MMAGLGDQTGAGLGARDPERARRQERNQAGLRRDRDCAAAPA